jgi:biopolymer transport protein ExbD
MSMSLPSGGEEDEINSTINTTPLVDIMLVLLIIFIITLPVMTHAVKIDLPRATDQPPPDNPAQPITIDVQFDGSVLWNGTVVSSTDMRSYIASAAKENPQPDVHLSVDRRARYDYAAAVLFAVERGGLKKIGFVADASGGL